VDAALVDGTYAAVQPPVVFSAALSNRRLCGGVHEARAETWPTAWRSGGTMNHAQRDTGRSRFTGWNDPRRIVRPEAALEAAHPFYANWKNGVQAALTCTVGGTAGNRCVVSAPRTQYKSIGPVASATGSTSTTSRCALP
jgi:hypothetical protein